MEPLFGKQGHAAASAGPFCELASFIEHLCWPFARQQAGSCASAAGENTGALSQKLMMLSSKTALARYTGLILRNCDVLPPQSFGEL